MRPLIVADIGLNHEGDLDRALRMVGMARALGVDYVKFQKRDPEVCYKAAYLERPKQSRWGTTVRDEKHGLELSLEDFGAIDAFCRRQGIPWFASPRDEASVDFLMRFDPPFLKVPSGCLTNRPLLAAVARRHIPLIISTGMATYNEIDEAIRLLDDHQGRLEYVLHAVSLYPCPDTQLHMNRIQTLKKLYDARFKIGYSHHSERIIHIIQAACLGAQMVEFHMTEDRSLPGIDQRSSIGPVGVKRIVDHLDNISVSWGEFSFHPSPEELAKGENYAWR